MPSKSASAAFKRATKLAAQASDSPIELALALWALEEEEDGHIPEIVNSTNIDRRTLYYLLEVGKKFGPMKLPNSRLAEVGWTKLQLLARHCPPGQMRWGLAEAKKYTAKHLVTVLKGGIAPTKGEKTYCRVVLTLTPIQYEIIASVLTEYGASKPPGKGKGLVNWEAALMTLIIKAQDAGITPGG